MPTVFITGGAGFIGSALIRLLIAASDWRIVNIDKLTYAGNLASLAAAGRDPRHVFRHHDICDRAALDALFAAYRPDGIIHLAAESHVDRSIHGPGEFIQTNVVGTYTLLEAARAYWSGLDAAARNAFRFHHVSTDEVFGSLGPCGRFDETTAYDPRSPYSASKAASDHLVRAWQHTYGLPTLITNCSNNYGPYQFPEKLIPLMIGNALAGKPLPIYGQGDNVRDWLYVDDHARALQLVFERGRPGETYCIGGCNEKTNLQVVDTLCNLLDRRSPRDADRRGRFCIRGITRRRRIWPGTPSGSRPIAGRRLDASSRPCRTRRPAWPPARSAPAARSPRWLIRRRAARSPPAAPR